MTADPLPSVPLAVWLESLTVEQLLDLAEAAVQVVRRKDAEGRVSPESEG